MNRGFFPVQRSILAGDAFIEQILVHYDLPQPITCHLYSGYANDIYVVQAGQERYWLRVYHHAERSFAEIEAETLILAELGERGLPVAQLMRSQEGKYLYSLSAPEGTRYCLLTAHAVGKKPGRDINAQQAAIYGRAVAQTHGALDALSQRYNCPDIDLEELLDQPLALLYAQLASQPDDCRFLEQVADYLRRRIASLPSTRPAYGLCHGDLHKSNVLIDDTGQPTLIDWDCLGYGWRAYELSVLRWSIGPAVAEEGIGEPRLSQVWNVYLESYESIRPLSDAERAIILDFVALRQIRVLGWDVERALDGRFGVWLLEGDYLHGWIKRLRHWVDNNCAMS